MAPIGPGCYELRRSDVPEKALFGRSKNVAYRMTSLLPPPWGAGRRSNSKKRDYVLRYLDRIEYRTLACTGEEEATLREDELRLERHSYRFRT
jgi:hypothetical protein